MESKTINFRSYLKKMGNRWRRFWEPEPTSSDNLGYIKPQSIIDLAASPEVESSTPLRLHLGELGIFVECSSCGVLQELEAVCHQCGASLCRDVENCRRSIFSQQLGTTVIVCPDCEQLLLGNKPN